MPQPVAGDLPIRITLDVIYRHIDKLTEPIYRKAQLLGVLRAKKRIRFGYDAADIRWKARVVRRQPQPMSTNIPNVEFTVGGRTIEAVLPWRGFSLGEVLTPVERLVGRKTRAVFPEIIDNIVQWAMEDFEAYLQKALYADGNASNNNLHGLETLFAYGSALSNSPLRAPNGTYAGHSTVLGGLPYGGSWTGDFPNGDGDESYHAWSPLIVDYTSSYFGTSATWDTAWRSAIRYAQSVLEKLQGEKADVCIMHPDLLRRAKDSVDEWQRIEVTPKSPIVDLGIQTLNFEGVELLDDGPCPDKTAYLLNTRRLEFISLQDRLIEMEAEQDVTRTKYFGFYMIGNLRAESPAYHAKLVEIS